MSESADANDGRGDFAMFKLENGEYVVYSRSNPNAWLQSEHVIEFNPVE